MFKNFQKDNMFKKISVVTEDMAVEITPQMAADMLLQNKHNRIIRELHVKYLISEINAGEFKFNGQPIIFSKEGNLMDGQHRLTACVESGTNIKTLVVGGLSQDQSNILDTGLKRNLGDFLNITGCSQPRRTAALIKNVLLKSIKSEHIDSGRMSISPAIGTRIYEKEKLAINAAIKNSDITTQAFISLPHSIRDYCFFVLTKVDKEKCDIFMTKFLTGDNLHRESIEQQTRIYIFSLYKARKYDGVRHSSFKHKIIDLILRAWNKKRDPQLDFKNELKKGALAFKDITVPI